MVTSYYLQLGASSWILFETQTYVQFLFQLQAPVFNTVFWVTHQSA